MHIPIQIPAAGDGALVPNLNTHIQTMNISAKFTTNTLCDLLVYLVVLGRNRDIVECVTNVTVPFRGTHHVGLRAQSKCWRRQLLSWPCGSAASSTALGNYDNRRLRA